MSDPNRSIICRALLMGWTLWLLASWWIYLQISGEAIWPGSAGGLMLRGLFLSALTGVIFAWPAWRMSQGRREVAGQTVGDMVVLAVIFLVMLGMVVWRSDVPGMSRPGTSTAWVLVKLSSVVLSWVVLCGWCIVRAGPMGPWGRSVLAGLMGLASVAGIGVAGLGGPVQAAAASPFAVAWQMVGPTDGRGLELAWLHGRVVGAVGLLGWAIEAARFWSGRGAGPTMVNPPSPDRTVAPQAESQEADMTIEFITPEERRRLEQRLEELKANRPRLSQRIAEARELGDLSENAEYHAAREEQGLQEAEIRRIEQRLKNAKTVDQGHLPDDIVFLGATVRLRDESSGEEDLYRLVGESSGHFDEQVIEVTAGSPMGQSLMKARVGETIRVDMPRGTRRFTVVEIL